MTKDEALKLALEALKMCRGVIRNNIENLVPIESPNPWFSQDVDRAVTAIREALAQPEQEPVALEDVYLTIIQWDVGGGKRSRRELARRIVAKYTIPPQRTWVGLTDEDKQIAFDDTQEGGGFWEFADAIEAKLKEKNT